MKKDELKKILKPLIKECIKEVLFEEGGTLSHVITEVAAGLRSTPRQVVKENFTPTHGGEDQTKKLLERKRKLLDSIGKDAYGGVDLFEGTTPTRSASSGQGPLKNQAPNDPGVDISKIFGSKSTAIYQRMMEKK